MPRRNPKRPATPDHLEGESLLEWERILDELNDAGKLETTDRALIVLYVTTWRRWREASRHVEEFGVVVKFGNGVPGPNPFYKIEEKEGRNLRALLVELGLTPSSRGQGVEVDASELEI